MTCYDEACGGGQYLGPLAPRPPNPPRLLPVSGPPAFCGGPCGVRRDPAACCRAKPATCYDEVCVGGAFVDTRPRPPGPRPGPLRPGECAMMVPCNVHPDPRACCRQKPAACRDPSCVNGGYAPVVRPSPTIRPLGSDCRTWSPCRVAQVPEVCCAGKPPGCDSWCDTVGRRGYVTPYGGGVADDDLFGMDF